MLCRLCMNDMFEDPDIEYDKIYVYKNYVCQRCGMECRRRFRLHEEETKWLHPESPTIPVKLDEPTNELESEDKTEDKPKEKIKSKSKSKGGIE